MAVSRYATIPLAALRRPVEFTDRVSGRLEQRRGMRLPAPPLVPTHADHLAAAHEVAGAVGCDECARTLPAVGAAVAGRLPDVLRQDGGAALAEALWVLVRHLRPERVVETGVARGVSSAFILDAMARNGDGHLWSIDLPLLRPGGMELLGCAISPQLRGRWTYVRGTSRRKLPSLLGSLGSIGLFSHDGLHTAACQAFEYRTAWAHLTAGGVLVSDDVHLNGAFTRFAASVQRAAVVVAEPVKTGAVGLLRR